MKARMSCVDMTIQLENRQKLKNNYLYSLSDSAKKKIEIGRCAKQTSVNLSFDESQELS